MAARYSPPRPPRYTARSTWRDRRSCGRRSISLCIPALVNGAAGVVATRKGVVFTITSVIVRNGKIAEMDVLADPERLARFDLTILDDRD
jgi:hypothetical protein